MALKNAAGRIKRLKQNGASEAIIRRNQLDVMRQSARFIFDLIGPDSFLDLAEDEDPTDYIARYILTISPMFPSKFKGDVFWEWVIDEISRISYGDEPDILKPAPRQNGQHAHPALLARRRMRALEWAAHLKSQGLRPKTYQPIIALAFGADWDAIRHWRASIEKVLGSRQVDYVLSAAEEGYFINHHEWHDSLADPLLADGLWYRSSIGLPEMSTDVIHGEWKKLSAILSV